MLEPKAEELIKDLINKSNLSYPSDLETAALLAEKAYSIAINFQECTDITRNKIEFNLAAIYFQLNNLTLSKSYLDLVKDKTITFVKKDEIGHLYMKLAHELVENSMKIECYRAAGQLFSKSKNWYKYCQSESACAKLLNESERFEEAIESSRNILRGSFYLEDHQEIAGVYCDLSTLFTTDPTNRKRLKYAHNLLKKALKILNNNNLKLEIFILVNLAAVLNMMKKYDEALINIRDALGKLLKLDDKLVDAIESDLHYNEGFAEAKLNNRQKAIRAFELSHTYALKTNQNNVWQSLEEIGTLHHLSKDFSEAKSFFEKSLEFYGLYCTKNNLNKSEEIVKRILNNLSINDKSIEPDDFSNNSMALDSLTQQNEQPSVSNDDNFDETLSDDESLSIYTTKKSSKCSHICTIS